MVPALIVVFAAGLLYWFPIRRWYLQWGATEAEATRPMPGDAVVPDPNYRTTLAITVNARPECIWPWLTQMGYRRGGLYSYDWLDRLFGYLDAPSANRILPGYQQLEAGEMIPMGRRSGFPVAAVAPNESLVLGDSNQGFGWSWTFVLVPIDSRHTRLISRNRAHIPSTLRWKLFLRLLEPAAFLMTRRMLIGLQTRAEDLARTTVAHKTAA